MRHLSGIMLFIAMLMWGQQAYAQQFCTSDRVCASAEEINAATDALCRRARIAEEKLPSVVADLATAQGERDVLEGRLIQLAEAPEKKGVPLWVRLATDVGVAGSAVGLGAAVGFQADPEVVVGVAVFAGGVLALRLILELF